MNYGRLVLAALVATIVDAVYGIVVWGMVLNGEFSRYPDIYRPDGDRGVLAYCGYDIHDLARHATFEEVCYLLWHRRLPTRAELGDLQSQLAAGRALPEGVLRLMRSLPPGNGMDLLRTLTSALGHYDPDAA